MVPQQTARIKTLAIGSENERGDGHLQTIHEDRLFPDTRAGVIADGGLVAPNSGRRGPVAKDTVAGQ